MSYECEVKKELLFEIHGRNPVNAPDRELFVNLGTRYHLNDQTTFIGTFGRMVTVYSDDSIGWMTYLGAQMHF